MELERASGAGSRAPGSGQNFAIDRTRKRPRVRPRARSRSRWLRPVGWIHLAGAARAIVLQRRTGVAGHN